MKKNPIINILFFVLTSTLFAQWDTPIAVTDSLSDNTNCVLFTYFPPDNDLLLIWEKSFDSTATSIYCRCVSPISPQMPILSRENVHFKNPQITGSYEKGVMFNLFYETDQNGINEIYYVKFYTSGDLSDTVPFVAQQESVGQMNASGGIVTWIQNGNVYFSEIKYENGAQEITEHAMIDSVSCKEPISSFERIAWIKTLKDSSQIRYSELEYYYPDYKWCEPKSITLPDNCSDIHFSSEDIFRGFITGELNNEITNVFVADLYDGVYEGMNFYPKLNKFDPTIFIVPKVTKKSSLTMFDIMAFVLDTLGSEIFVNSDDEYYVFSNVSNNSFVERNPCLFSGKYNSVLLIWESYINNHWQLYATTSYYSIGSVKKDGEEPNDFLLDYNYPNPFNAETVLTYSINTPSKTRLSIFNLEGQEVTVLFDGFRLAGNYSVKWNGIDKNNHRVSTGIYFVILQSDHSRSCRKIILSR